MLPFSLGHRILLEQIESSFVCGVFPSFDDLISSAFICAHTWEENQKMLRSPFRRLLTLKVWGWLAGKFNIPTAIMALHKYIQDGNEFPEVREKPGEMRMLAMPHLARLYLFLRSNGFSESETMNMPLLLANLLYCTDAEQDGRLEMITDVFKETIRRSQGAKAA